MKLTRTTITIAFASLVSTDGFSIHQGNDFLSSSFPKKLLQLTSTVNQQTSKIILAAFKSDFQSAMPEKPKLSFQEQMEESATTFIADVESRLAEGVSAPPELEELRAARDDGADASELALKVYILMIEQGMVYDSDPETGALSYTNFDIKGNLEVPEVKQEFAYLYTYGINLIGRGVIGVDRVKEEVKQRLIDRTGLSPEKFDEWLGY